MAVAAVVVCILLPSLFVLLLDPAVRSAYASPSSVIVASPPPPLPSLTNPVWSHVSSLAEASSIQLDFVTLSKLTGNPQFR